MTKRRGKLQLVFIPVAWAGASLLTAVGLFAVAPSWCAWLITGLLSAACLICAGLVTAAEINAESRLTAARIREGLPTVDRSIHTK